VIEYLLDTNVCIDLINGTTANVRKRFKEVLVEGSIIGVSILAVHELWYGVAKSKKRDFNTERVQAFLSGPIHLIDFDDADARAAGEVRALLEHERRPIGAYDSLIAGQAVRRGFTLVTANLREFARVDGLAWEDWTESVR
jgi:tRNA(fMet)-specific endonuclease VapC